jgi:hypothetical protein
VGGSRTDGRQYKDTPKSKMGKGDELLYQHQLIGVFDRQQKQISQCWRNTSSEPGIESIG